MEKIWRSLVLPAGSELPRERRTCELRRITLPRSPLNKGQGGRRSTSRGRRHSSPVHEPRKLTGCLLRLGVARPYHAAVCHRADHRSVVGVIGELVFGPVVEPAVLAHLFPVDGEAFGRVEGPVYGEDRPSVGGDRGAAPLSVSHRFPKSGAPIRAGSSSATRVGPARKLSANPVGVLVDTSKRYLSRSGSLAPAG